MLLLARELDNSVTRARPSPAGVGRRRAAIDRDGTQARPQIGAGANKVVGECLRPLVAIERAGGAGCVMPGRHARLTAPRRRCVGAGVSRRAGSANLNSPMSVDTAPEGEEIARENWSKHEQRTPQHASTPIKRRLQLGEERSNLVTPSDDEQIRTLSARSCDRRHYGLRTIFADAQDPWSRSTKACAPSRSGRSSTQDRSPKAP